MKFAYAWRHGRFTDNAHGAAVLPIGLFLTGWLLAVLAVLALPLLAMAAVILRALAYPRRMPQHRPPTASVIDGDYELIEPNR